jgi:uncharacterized protein YjbI with pentapeptide repeats
LIDATDNLSECILNYVTATQVMEVVDANIKTNATLKGFELINCKVEGIFEDCFFVGSEIRNSQVSKSKLQHSDAKNSKILNCNVEASALENCYFMDGYLNAEMIGGIYRSGRLGPFASMDSEVKIVTDNNNFFDTKFEDETKGDKKGVIDIKSFGKK